MATVISSENFHFLSIQFAWSRCVFLIKYEGYFWLNHFWQPVLTDQKQAKKVKVEDVTHQ